MTLAGTLLSRIRWQGLRFASRFDAPALVALVAGCLVILFHVFVLVPQQRGLASAARTDGDLRTAPARAVQQVVRTEDAEALALERFYGFFRGGERQPDVIARLVVMAGELGLAYRRIDYRPIPETSLGLDGFQIQIPLAGAYPDLRNFVSTVLTRMPTMTLDQIEITRRKDGRDGVEAQVSFSYHYAEAR
jgi:Tfp pilus assembly protein PilO